MQSFFIKEDVYKKIKEKLNKKDDYFNMKEMEFVMAFLQEEAY